MGKKEFNINNGEFEIIDGRVVITSEELALAITEQQLNLDAEEAAEELVVNIINCSCKVS